MKVNTRKFGEIVIDEEKTLTMPEGLPGFPGYEKFVLLEDPKTAPFSWLQSLEAPDLALVIMNPFVFKPDYHLDLGKFIQDMNWTGVKQENLLIYVVVNIRGEKENKTITANLMGPLVINPETKEVVQVIISDPYYPCQYNILEETQPENKRLHK